MGHARARARVRDGARRGAHRTLLSAAASAGFRATTCVRPPTDTGGRLGNHRCIVHAFAVGSHGIQFDLCGRAPHGAALVVPAGRRGAGRRLCGDDRCAVLSGGHPRRRAGARLSCRAVFDRGAGGVSRLRHL
ncbi:hypothetical protein CBM2633_B11090 [Cupriavidus taiwanensis]|nr:hypothetical protein CBM2604_B10125 [Cupriavidus taiwanensis]SOZ29867.1 hypothetical protein CBM2609_B10126 [Cupriavidus taiwanensis]SOZ46972.1 hypothetical protein CBM2610_B10125 [Cupriavidus taiwanensis]SPA18860.1 hypothetical protein CBM2633_B11090 [Cupriavidus taiwanensis]